MKTIAEIRKQFPMYSDLSDTQLVDGLRQKYYSDMSPEQFHSQVEMPTANKMVWQGNQLVNSATGKPSESALPSNVGPAGGDSENPFAYLSEGQKTEQGPAMQTVSQGVNRGVQIGAGIAKGAVINPVASVAQMLGGDQFAQDAQKSYETQRANAGATGMDWAELAGSIVSPANRILPGGPVTQGAVGAMLNPVIGENLSYGDILSNKLQQGVVGGILGKTLDVALPAFKEGARKLLDAGVSLEPGQAFGGVGGALMRSTEGVRETIYNIVGKGTPADKVNKAFTYATVNEALAPIGKSINKEGADGFDLVNQGVTLARKAYGEAFNKVGNVIADDTFMKSVGTITQNAKDALEPKDYNKLMAEIKRNVVERFKPIETVTSKATGAEPGVLSRAFQTDGEKLHMIKRYLNGRLENLANETTEVGVAKKNVLQDLMDNFKQFTYRVDETGAIKAADQTYTDMFRVAAAAKSASSKGGTFNPDQLLASATAQSGTLAGGAGTAPMQKYAREALKVIGKQEEKLAGTRFTPSDLKNLGVASGLGYAGLFNLPVIAGATAAGTTADLLGKLALKNPAAYEALRKTAIQQGGALGQAGGDIRNQLFNQPTQQPQQQQPIPVQQQPQSSVNQVYPKLASTVVGTSKFDPEHPVAQKVRAEAERQGLGQFADLLVRQAYQESKFNPNAKSSKQAGGVMQIIPSTAKELGVKNVFNPDENIRGGVAYMKQLLQKYKGNPEMALAAYNWGPGNVDKKGLNKLPAETQGYLKNILGA
jgi:soluble lytic murein transglycosylase-like protein